MTLETKLDQRMAAYLSQWEQAGDRRLIFLACYRMMTQNMLAALTSGRFYDRDWVARLTHRFAEYYFVALDAYESGAAQVPKVWHHAHEQTRSAAISTVQHLLLGINAHINYDLVFTLLDLLKPEWEQLSAAQRRLRYRDHCEVNVIIAETLDSVQDTVVERYTPWFNLVDTLCGPLDEWLTLRLIRNWRADVWRQATVLINTHDGAEYTRICQHVEAAALQRATLVTDGSALASHVFGYPLRWLQRQDEI